MGQPIVKMLLSASLVTLAACSFEVFNELGDQAPAARITQEGEIRSSTFGDQLVGLDRGGKKGGMLGITGNASVAISTATFSQDGTLNSVHAEADVVDKALNAPNSVLSMSAAPVIPTSSSSTGPFVYVGSDNGQKHSVRVIDVSTTRIVRDPIDAPTQPAAVSKFGLAVAPAVFNQSKLTQDLAVGAKDAVVLLRARTGEWPLMEDTAVVVNGGTSWRSGDYTVITAGDLDSKSDEHEVVAASPGRSVVVIHSVADCFADSTAACTRSFSINNSTGGFGTSLLIADLDGDGKNELLVGAPGANKVFVYRLTEENFRGTDACGTGCKTGYTCVDQVCILDPPTPEELTAKDARDFGQAMAFGKVTAGTQDVLAVGAPDTAVGGTKGAGAIYLFQSSGGVMKEIGKAELASPEENMFLGKQLAVMPFAVPSQSTPYELLAAAGKKEVFVFFSSLTKDHKDVRDR